MIFSKVAPGGCDTSDAALPTETLNVEAIHLSAHAEHKAGADVLNPQGFALYSKLFQIHHPSCCGFLADSSADEINAGTEGFVWTPEIEFHRLTLLDNTLVKGGKYGH